MFSLNVSNVELSGVPRSALENSSLYNTENVLPVSTFKIKFAVRNGSFFAMKQV